MQLTLMSGLPCTFCIMTARRFICLSLGLAGVAGALLLLLLLTLLPEDILRLVEVM